MSTNTNTNTCKNFVWNPVSAATKLFSNSTLSFNIGNILNIKTKTGNFNPKKDAYRNCLHCGKHINKH